MNKDRQVIPKLDMILISSHNIEYIVHCSLILMTSRLVVKSDFFSFLLAEKVPLVSLVVSIVSDFKPCPN